MREPATTSSWLTGVRLTGDKRMFTNTNGSESSDSNVVFDSNVGYFKDLNSARQAWMWKRHAGFDVVAFEGTNSAGLQIAHSLNAVPEMMWIKNRDASENWAVYHKGLNGGTNPEDYVIRLNSTDAEFNNNEWWNDTAPTSTHFTLGISGEANGFEKSMLAMLFASVDGISSVGSYNGSGSSGNAQNIGFSPRFLIIKRTNGSDPWMVFDTLRGINNSGDDKLLYLNDNDSQGTIGDHDWISISSTGFSLSDGNGATNTSGGSYIYFAHA